jgi:hypothetical protein
VTTKLLRLSVGPALLVLMGTGCGSDEQAAPPDHTPTTYNLEIEGVPVTEPYSIPTGQTVRVRIKFFNEAGEDLDDVEAEHFAGLSFSPSDLVTVERVSDRHYQFDVTGGTPAGGTLRVGFGHDEAADETVFDPAQVNVTGGGGAN